MNLIGDPTKQLLKSVRGGAPTGTVGTWAAISALDALRKRRARKPSRELLLRKKLKPGESYVIRVPGDDEEGMEPGQKYAVTPVKDSGIDVVGALADAAGALLGFDREPEQEPQPEPEEAAPPVKQSRRRRKQEKRRALVEKGRVDTSGLSRRRRRKLEKAERRALRRPTRRRVRKARKRQRRAAADD